MAASCVGTAVPVWLREEDLSCIICQELLDGATTLPCGHSFCLQCLSDLWLAQHAGVGGRPWACPLCREGLPDRPKLHRNTLLQDLVDKYRQAAQELQAGPEPASAPESPPHPAPPQVAVQKRITEVTQELTGLMGQLVAIVKSLQTETTSLRSGLDLGSLELEYSLSSTELLTPSASQRKIREVLCNLEEIQDKLQGIDEWKEAPGEQTQERPQSQRRKEEQREVYNQEPTGPLYDGIEEWYPQIVKTPPQVFSVTAQQRPADNQHSQGYVQISCRPTKMIDLRRFKEAVNAYGMHSPYVKDILDDWASQYKVTPQDWEDLIRAVLDTDLKLQWLFWRKEEAADMEQSNRIMGVNVQKDQLLGEGKYDSLTRQVQFDDATIEQCRLVTLRAWDKVEEKKKSSISFERILQRPREPYSHFLQRLTLLTHRLISNPVARELSIKLFAFANANRVCQKAIRPLKEQEAPLEEYVRATAHIGPAEYDAIVIGEAIAKALRYQNTKCFNCGQLGHIRKDCLVTLSNTSLENNQNRMPQPPGVCRRCGKGKHWIDECKSVRDVYGNLLPSRNQM
nr:E3 ubiquitin-protein ligase RNF135 isoform X1 [Meriones unguiculatus]